MPTVDSSLSYRRPAGHLPPWAALAGPIAGGLDLDSSLSYRPPAAARSPVNKGSQPGHFHLAAFTSIRPPAAQLEHLALLSMVTSYIPNGER